MKDQYIFFKILSTDRKELVRVAERLDLRPSEVGRRALRLGLASLAKVTLPGGKR